MKILRTASFTVIITLFLLAMGGMAFGQDEGTDTEDEDQATETTVTSTTTSTATSTTAASEADTGQAQGRPRISVYTFENPPNYYNSTIGNGLTSIIITYLTQSGRFDIIQRGENLDLLIEEIDLGQSGYIDQETAVEMGHILGVEYILSGRVTNFGYEETSTGGLLGGFGGFGGLDVSEEEAVVRLDFALIDATTGQTVLAATSEGKTTNTGVEVSGADYGDWYGDISYDSDEFMDSMIGKATLKAVNNLITQILQVFPIQAPILAVTPDFIILDIGVNAGIEVGMEFDVYRVEAVTNAEGEVVWEEKTLTGRVVVTEVELTTCKAELVSGADPREGDLCILVGELTVDSDEESDGNPHRD